jgi:hypothetical protein
LTLILSVLPIGTDKEWQKGVKMKKKTYKILESGCNETVTIISKKDIKLDVYDFCENFKSGCVDGYSDYWLYTKKYCSYNGDKMLMSSIMKEPVIIFASFGEIVACGNLKGLEAFFGELELIKKECV